jgi:hypothetical protein
MHAEGRRKKCDGSSNKGGTFMAWNNVGPLTTLEPGQSVTWWYNFPNGQDIGVQIAGPNVFASPADLGTLVASNQGKQIFGINNVNYVVTITNVGPPAGPNGGGGGTHNLQGGGVV